MDIGGQTIGLNTIFDPLDIGIGSQKKATGPKPDWEGAKQAQGGPIDWGGIGQMGSTGEEARDQAITGAYNQATSRLDPQWARREEGMNTRLLNQGLDPSSEAYKNSMFDLGQQRNDAYSSAMNGAIAQGTQAGGQMFQQGMMTRQQALAEALRRRNQPLDEVKQWHQMWKNDVSDKGDTQKDIGGAALSMIGALSDERAKTDIVRLGVEALPGVPFAEWTYLPEFDSSGRRHRGVIAQDLEKVAPQYVHEVGGLKHVDYSFLDGVTHG